jgi:dTDP-glucose 4,6-dehydratase
MRILVTGGAGFIGSNLVHYLLNDASADLGLKVETVVTLDKLTYSGNRASLVLAELDARHVFVHGDIGDPHLLDRVLRRHAIDAVMHLAAESHVDRSIDDPESFILTNFVGTFRLLESFRRYVIDTGRLAAAGRCAFLHVSTDEVYGSLAADSPAFCETTRYAPNSPYSASKAGSDHLVRAYHHTYGMPVITTHCSNNYGPYQFPEKLLPLMIRKTLRGEALPVYGDGRNVRDWLYVRDHCRALTMALTHGKFGETYLIGGKCEMRNIDMVEAIVETVRELAPERGILPVEELIHYVKDRPGHDRRYAIDPSRIENELGWSPRETFFSGLRKTVQWYIDHEEWIAAIESDRYQGERMGTLV